MSDLTSFAIAGTRIDVRASPKASRNKVVLDEGLVRVYVTAVPENGKANAAIIKLLAKAVGVPKSRLRLVRGDTGRDKVFEVL